MKRDADRHRKLLFLTRWRCSSRCPVALVPGPNVLGYLFTFTVVGHFLAWRGAVNAPRRSGVDDCAEPGPDRSPPRVYARSRHAPSRIRDVADRLHMPRMARFVERMAATPTA